MATRLPDRLFDSIEEENEVMQSMSISPDEPKRIKIQEGYRSIMKDLVEKKQEYISPTSHDDLLSDALSKVDKLFSNVHMAREATMDSASLVRIADLGKMKAQALKTDFVAFNLGDFCENVRLAFTNDVSDPRGLETVEWVALGSAAQPFYSRTPVLRFMCGSFEAGDVSARPARVRKQVDKDADEGKATKPLVLSSFEKTDRGELTTIQVEHLLSTLWSVYEQRGKRPVSFFKFITHPRSFGHTVENIFYASFLVRDGHARILMDQYNLPVIEPIKKDDSVEQERQANGQSHQVIMSLTPKQWREIVEVFCIKEPLIKNALPNPVLRDREGSNNSVDLTTLPPQGKGKGIGKRSVNIS